MAKMDMNFWEILILFFSFQALLLAVLFLIRRKGDRIANSILALFLVLFSYNLFFNVLYWSHVNPKLFLSLAFTYLLPLSLYGPLFYFYVRRIVTATPFSPKDLVHLTPFLFLLIYFSPIYLQSAEKKLELYRSGQFDQHIGFVTWYGTGIVLLMCSYGLAAFFKFIRTYREDKELALWLKTISLSFVLFCGSHIVYRGLLLLQLTTIDFDYYITLFMVLLIGAVCYFAFVHSLVFNGTPIEKVIPFIKYEKTGLTEDFSLELKEKLEKIFQEEKPFLDPEIRLDNLAELLDVSRHHASQIINEHFSMSFFEYINRHRIREAKRLLSGKSSDLLINDVAYLSGFNNRISFYKAFKKIVGTTPSEYRENHKF